MSKTTIRLLNTDFEHPDVPKPFDNVIAYQFGLNEPNVTITTAIAESDTPHGGSGDIHVDSAIERSVFLVVDTSTDALAHWVFEVFIFQHIFDRLFAEFPHLQIVTQNTKRYVRNMFKMFSIQQRVVNNLPPGPNTCFFVKPVSLTERSLDAVDFERRIDLYVEYLNRVSKPPVEFSGLELDLLYLPRNTADNYTMNDRKIEHIEALSAEVIAAGGTVLNTYALNNLTLQFFLIGRARCIILEYGSAYYFNCIHLRHKTIIVMGAPNNQLEYPSCATLHRKISQNNRVLIVDRYVPGQVQSWIIL